MKTKNSVFVLFLFYLVTFPVHAQNKQKADGWYLMTDYENQTVGPEPIVTVADFETLRIDSGLARDNRMSYFITGKIKSDKTAAFAQATEAYVGKHIAFLYNGKILSNPRVNMRIEGGYFMISSPEINQDKAKMLEILVQLKKQMK